MSARVTSPGHDAGVPNGEITSVGVVGSGIMGAGLAEVAACSVKKFLFEELDEVVKPAAVLATNTSTLPVVDLAVATRRPDRVCGIHFFNPVPAMALVDVVRPITASDDTVKTALGFVTTCSKNAVEVVDRAGFVVNALLFPYLNNAVRMLEHGTASTIDIDAAVPTLRRMVAAGHLGRKSGRGFYEY